MGHGHSRLLRSAGSMALITAVSRVTGYARDFIQAVFLGATHTSDAFIIAFRIPNLMRRLAGEGVMTAAFVPVFAETEARQGRRELWRFAGSFFNALALMLSACALLGLVCAPWIVRAMAYGFTRVEGKEALATDLTRLMLPYLIFIGLAALEAAILNSLGRFALPASTPILLNLTIIAAALTFAWRVPEPAFAFAGGVLAGGLLQMAVLSPPLWKAGLRLPPCFGFGNPEVRRTLSLMVTGAFGAGIYHVNLLVDSLFASFLPGASVSYLYYASRITELVVGVFVVSMSTALLPSLSRKVLESSPEAARRTLELSLRQVAFLTLPACAGLIALAEPIVHVLFERGRFDAASAALTVPALSAYALGVPAVAVLSVLTRAFYARQQMRAPVRASAWTLLLHVALNLWFVSGLGLAHPGIALSTSLSAVFNLVLLARLYPRRWGIPWSAGVWISAARCAAVSVAMAVACSAVLRGSGFHARMPAAQVLILGTVIITGMALYTGALRLLAAPEPTELLEALRSHGEVPAGPSAPEGF